MPAKITWVAVPYSHAVGRCGSRGVSIVPFLNLGAEAPEQSGNELLLDWTRNVREHLRMVALVFMTGNAQTKTICIQRGSSATPSAGCDSVLSTLSETLAPLDPVLWDKLDFSTDARPAALLRAETWSAPGQSTPILRKDIPTRFRSYPAARVARSLLEERSARAQGVALLRALGSDARALASLPERDFAARGFWDNLQFEDLEDVNQVPHPMPPAATPEADHRDRALHRVSVDPTGSLGHGAREAATAASETGAIGATSAADASRQAPRLRRKVFGHVAQLGEDTQLGEEEAAFVDLAAFHRTRAFDRDEKVEDRVEATECNRRSVDSDVPPTFEERLTAARTVPSLLRPLGLALDICLDAVPESLWQQLQTAPDQTTVRTVHVEVEWDFSWPGTSMCPRTAYVLSGAPLLFRSRDRQEMPGVDAATCKEAGLSWLTWGYARFAEPADADACFSVLTMDQDGAGLASLSVAATRVRQEPLVELVVDEASECRPIFVAGRGPTLQRLGFQTAHASLESTVGLTAAAAVRNVLRSCASGGLRTPIQACPAQPRPLRIAGRDYQFTLCRLPAPADAGCRPALLRIWPEGAEASEHRSDLDLPPFRNGGLVVVQHGAGLDLGRSILSGDARLGELRTHAAYVSSQRCEVDVGIAPLVSQDLASGLVGFVFARNPRAPSQCGWFSTGARRDHLPTAPDLGIPTETIGRLPTPFHTKDTSKGIYKDAQEKPELQLSETVYQYLGATTGVAGPDACPEPRRPGEWRLEIPSSEEMGSLPPLRFAPALPLPEQEGFAFRVALATADIAGNHVHPSRRLPRERAKGRREVDEVLSVVYRRMDVVAPPLLLPTPWTCDGNRETRRADRLRVQTGGGPAERWVIPPRVSRDLAECHGCLDQGTLSAIGGMEALRLDGGGKFPSEEADGGWTVVAPAGRWTHRKDGFNHYYPDPAAWGFRLTVRAVEELAPGRTWESIVPWYDESCWPRARPWRLRTVAGRTGKAGMPVLRELRHARMLLLYIPPSWDLQLEVSSVLGPPEGSLVPLTVFDHYARWEDRRSTPASRAHRLLAAVEQAFKGDDQNSALSRCLTDRLRVAGEKLSELGPRDMLCGRDPYLTPILSATAVHASPGALHAPALELPATLPPPPASATGTLPASLWQPVPEGDATAAARSGNDVSILGTATVDTKSTDRLQIEARWREPTDVAGTPAPGWTEQQAHVETLCADRVTSADVTSEQFSAVHHTGRSKHLVVDYSAAARNRHHSSFVPEFGGPGSVALRKGATTRVHVLNRAAPSLPCPVYAVPAFRWEARREALSAPPFEQFRNTRFADVIRVYVRRGLLETGEDELIGVVVVDEEPLAEVTFPVSRWGKDPTRVSHGGPRLPTLQKRHIAGHEIAIPASALPGGIPSNSRCSIMGFRPKFDPEQRLWYVDVRLVPPVDHLFVRLALTRLQPWSVRGCASSFPCIADFVQIWPDRSVVVLRDVGDSTAHSLLVRVVASRTPEKGTIEMLAPTVRVVVPTYGDGDVLRGYDDDDSVDITDVTAEDRRPPAGVASPIAVAGPSGESSGECVLRAVRVALRDYRRPRKLYVEEVERASGSVRRAYVDVLDL